MNQATVTIEHQFDDGLTLRNATRYGDYYRYYRTEILGAVNYTNNRVAVTQNLRDNVQRNLINQSELAWKGHLGEREASLLLGLELSKEHYEFRGKNSTGTRTISVFDPQQPDGWGPGRASDLDGTLDQRNETDASTVAGYVLGTVDVVPDVKAVLGLRVDRFSADFSSGPTTTAPVIAEFSSEDTMVSPRAGLVWTPVPELSTYVSWSRAFNPSAETYSLSTATTDLDPEQTDNYEVGAKATLLDDALTFGAALFRLDKSKARTTDPTNTTLQVLDGKQRTDGIELEAAGTVGHWSVQAGVAFIATVPVLRLGEARAIALGPDDAHRGLLERAADASSWLVVGPVLPATVQPHGAVASIIPLDAAGTAAHQPGAMHRSLAQWIAAGRAFIWPIIAACAVGLGIIIVRLVVLLRSRVDPRQLIAVAGLIARRELMAARASVAQRATPLDRVLGAGLDAADQPREAREAAVEQVLLAESARLTCGLTAIAVLAGVAPLLGLLGTVTGMIDMFSVIAAQGSGNAKSLSGGISEALICTQAGMLVAIPLLLAHAWLSRMAERRSQVLEEAACGVLGLSEHGERSTERVPEAALAR